MEVPARRKEFALDANILYDLAQGKDFAHTLRECLQEARAVLHVPPTVVQELAYNVGEADNREERELAFKALKSMRGWGLVPYDLVAVGHGITEQFARSLMRKGYLPESELNDGLIVAEVALAKIPCLITRDEHLLGIDKDRLKECLDASDFQSVDVVHPRKLLSALKPKFKESRLSV